MKRVLVFGLAGMAMLTAAQALHAGAAGIGADCLHHHFAGMSAAEKQLLRFWADHYRALEQYYQSAEEIDWVAYYKQNGYDLNPGGRIHFAPVSPAMQWAVPNSVLNGPPMPPPMRPFSEFPHEAGSYWLPY